MANYTMTIQKMIELGIEIFYFDYELYDNTQKSRLQNLFIHHNYFNEISFETSQIWLFAFRTKWIEVLPKYNKLWLANNININPMFDQQTTRTNKTKQDNVSKSNTLNSYTDVAITGVSETNYPSSQNKNNADNESNNNFELYEEVNSLNKSQVSALEEYNNKITDIDMQFINEFRQLFMLIF